MEAKAFIDQLVALRVINEDERALVTGEKLADFVKFVGAKASIDPREINVFRQARGLPKKEF